MKIINVSDNVENFILNKMEIEKYLIENSDITEPMEISKFITWLGMENTIYYHGEVVMPYRYLKLNDTEYLFLSGDDKEQEELISSLKECEYNPTSLKNVTAEYFITHPDFFEASKSFIINGKYYSME